MKYILSILTIFGCLAVQAQTDIDAYRFSTPLSIGTARSAAIGNATTGIGGDISTLNSNPAGLAQMSISEFSISGGFNVTGSRNNYLGTQTDAQKSAFQLNNLGLVYVPKKKFTKIKNISIAGSYNRTASFSYQVNASGVNNNSSYSDIYAEQLNNDGNDSASAMTNYPFGSSLAFESGLIGRTDDNFFYSILDLPITQRYQIKRSGNMNDFSMGTGIAFNDQWMVGLSIGIPSINYEEEFYVTETDHANVNPEFIYWDKTDKYRTEGTGINAKFGVLFHPNPNIRLGASFTTPTRYSMKDLYLTAFRADYETYTMDNFNSPAEGYFNYKMKTPLKFNAGASYVNPDFGFVSVEYEYSDPSKTKYIFADNEYNLKDFESNLNDGIASKYKAIHTMRVGVEGKIAQKFRGRAGFQYRTSGFSNQESVNDFAKNTVMAFSGGFGYRGKSVYTDIAYVHTLSDEYIIPYTVSLAESPVLSSKYNRSNFILTVGFKF